LRSHSPLSERGRERNTEKLRGRGENPLIFLKGRGKKKGEPFLTHHRREGKRRGADSNRKKRGESGDAFHLTLS